MARQKKKAHASHLAWASKKSRRRPTLPLGYPSSTIGSKELNFRVREGIGCDLLDITTGNCGCSHVRPDPRVRVRPNGAFEAPSLRARSSSPELRAQTLMFALEVWSSRTTY